jgi:hypothetical protein
MKPRGEETTQKDGSTLVDQKQKHGRANETTAVAKTVRANEAIAALEIIIYFVDHGP